MNPKKVLDGMSHDEAINEMKGFIDESIFVGIFWIDDNDELIDVNKVPYKSLNKGQYTIQVFHKTIWQKKHHRALAKKQQGILQEKDKIYLRDYTKVRRGRVFFKDAVFTVKVGSWVNDFIKGEIMDEFELPKDKTVFSVDIHWELGHGWASEEDALEL
jgi:hypothetical protein